MKEKEKELTRRIGLYFARGGGDGDALQSNSEAKPRRGGGSGKV